MPGLAYLAGAGVVAISLLLLGLTFFFPGLLLNASRPLSALGTSTTRLITDATSIFANTTALMHERDELQAHVALLTEENRLLRAHITDQAGFTTVERVRAGVLSRPPVAPYDTLLVSAGHSRGISVGAFVYGPGGVPLGTVDAVTDTASRVGLFSTGGRTTEGWVGEKRIPITLTGRGSGAYQASLPRDSGAAVHDVVYVSGPGALPIGTIVRITSDPSAPRDTVFIAPYANLFSLTWVEIAR